MKKIIDLSKLNNFDYYSKNLLYIQAGEGLIPFDYEKRWVQVQLNKEWESHLRKNLPILFIILKARRHGVSTYIQSRMFQGCHTNSHRQAITIAADDEGCSYIHNMSHVFYEFLPEELQPVVKYKSSSKLVFDVAKGTLIKPGKKRLGLKSSMRTVACNERAGLGVGSHYIHFSEYSHFRDADAVRKAVIPTAFNVPGTFTVIESTANGMIGVGEPFYLEWKKAKEGRSVFKPLFYSWLQHEDYSRPFYDNSDRDELIDTLDSEEEDLKKHQKATLEQLNWRRHQIKFLGEGIGGDFLKSGLENFHEQYPATDDEAFIVSGNPVFDRVVLREYKQKCKEPIWIGDVEGGGLKEDHLGNLKVWEFPIEDAKYIVSVDAASGEPGATDFACVEVFRVLNVADGLYGSQCAEWHGKVGADFLGKIAVVLAEKYNMALIAPEVFGYGHHLLTAIQNLEYWNILSRTTVDSIDRISKTKLGWKTDTQSKMTLLSCGRTCINGKRVVIKSEALVDELMIFVRDSSGPGAQAYGRGKDDRVMTFLINMKAIEQEYGGLNLGNIGIVQPPKEGPIKIEDKLTHDDFWDRKHEIQKSWLDL